MLRQQLKENTWDNGVANHGVIYAATHGRGLFKCESLRGPLSIRNYANNQKNYSFDVYPNPASDFISIHQNQNKNSRSYIYNIKGELVSYKQLTHREDKINVSNLPKGTYIIKVFTDESSNSRRFLKL